MTTRTALISCAGRYMGPAIKEKFESLGITVVSGDYPMTTQTDCEELVSAAGQVDILIANLAEPPMTGPVQDIENADWNKLFDSLVHPLMYLIRAVTPQMLDRQAGKIIAITSAAPLKGIANNTAYCAARGAQNGFIKAVGLELARSNIQVNAIAQNYINNNTYYPDDILDNEKFLDHVKRNVPTNKVGAANETAQLAAYLAREDCRHMVGQVIPLAGGWVT
ncbi:MAG: SDR family oxidoreductase [Gammaproteobacteria bacterium]|nr:SDR family oxidoreductase [Gammaproteobacteria bacterium]MDP6731709.1 SDR family oxidoreductase [Gammaproteobacteria bacterium]